MVLPTTQPTVPPVSIWRLRGQQQQLHHSHGVRAGMQVRISSYSFQKAAVVAATATASPQPWSASRHAGQNQLLQFLEGNCGGSNSNSFTTAMECEQACRSELALTVSRRQLWWQQQQQLHHSHGVRAGMQVRISSYSFQKAAVVAATATSSPQPWSASRHAGQNYLLQFLEGSCSGCSGSITAATPSLW